MKPAAYFLILILVLFIFGCAQKTTTMQQQQAEVSRATKQTVQSVPQNPISAEVKIYDSGFKPQEVTIAAGGTVRWVNYGQKDHTVYGENFPMPSSQSPKNSGRLQPGEIWEKTFNEQGYYSYADIYDDTLTGKVIVQ